MLTIQFLCYKCMKKMFILIKEIIAFACKDNELIPTYITSYIFIPYKFYNNVVFIFAFNFCQ